MATVQGITLDPSDPYEAVLMELARNHREHPDDYQSHYDVAYQLGLTPGHMIEVGVAETQSVLRLLGIENKRIIDSTTQRMLLIQRARFAADSVALFDEGSYAETWAE